MALRHGRMRLFEVRIRPCGHNSVKTARFDKSPERELSDLGFSGLMQRILKRDCFFSALDLIREPDEYALKSPTLLHTIGSRIKSGMTVCESLT